MRLVPLLMLLALALTGCPQGSLYDFDGDGIPDGVDCAPEDASVHQGADEVCFDGLDNDCSGLTDSDDPDCQDADEDGFIGAVDCNDGDSSVHPGAVEVCSDSLDNDCDFLIDFEDPDCSDAASDDDDSAAINEEGDDPGEGLYDCDDPDCFAAPDCEEELNTPPTAPVVAIYPSNPHSTEPLNCFIEVPSEDVDEHLVTYTWAWSRDAVDAQTESMTVPADETSTGEAWTCTVTPNDGLADGAAGTDVVTVTNDPPSQPGVHVFPDPAITLDDLTCVVEAASVDPEGLKVNYSFEWLKDGNPTGNTTQYVSASETSGGESWRCIVTPSDGEDDGPIGQDDAPITIPTGCWDGTVEVGAGGWGRNDIVFCSSLSGFSTSPAEMVVNCGYGWHVCSYDEYADRNDLFSDATYFHGMIDDGANCGAWNNSGAGGCSAGSDYVLDSSAGSCSGPAGSVSYGLVGRLSSCVEGIGQGGVSCGVLCCYD